MYKEDKDGNREIQKLGKQDDYNAFIIRMSDNFKEMLAKMKGEKSGIIKY